MTYMLWATTLILSKIEILMVLNGSFSFLNHLYGAIYLGPEICMSRHGKNNGSDFINWLRPFGYYR